MYDSIFLTRTVVAERELGHSRQSQEGCCEAYRQVLLHLPTRE